LCGYDTIEFESGFNALEFVKSANLHRRHLTTKQRIKLAAAELKAHPERTDRETAKIVQLSRQTVGDVRRKLEANVQIGHKATEGIERDSERLRLERRYGGRDREIFQIMQ
jgi:hypothetical protein